MAPSDTVSTVSDLVAALVDDAAAGLVDAMTPPLVEAMPKLEPVLQPVAELVNGNVPPVSLPELESASFNPASALAGDPAGSPASQGGEASVSPAAGAMAPQQDRSGIAFGDSLANTGLASSWAGMLLHDDPSPVPAPAPPGPSSGSGSGASPAGSPGSAAWLDTFDFYLPLAGVVPLGGSSEHAPSPVSFDPGSSPD
ncbi:hypothetical protein J7E83_01890 [Arthrobacter sp. ISL-48]|uniref:hypothetical protein n=1 Tax=Arthrobacter sp. ISL-48 TaxID=2819110 RepID=UPI001BECD3CC|nr:hypothetical protein [Arthrobacter sp. ISL-48]MBT2530893.1 hypothetical protein [Arthrobacter sp. ISL-48]